ncbi:MAG: hypothetical protein FJX52_05445 [Alphaproteobacteria bacterium]|nr:hypothetical protein [Alphaproteobacteria bacterium]
MRRLGAAFGLVAVTVLGGLGSTPGWAQAECQKVEELLRKRQNEAAATLTLEPSAGVCAASVSRAFLKAGNRDRAQELINRAARFADPLRQPELTAEILTARIELDAAPEILREDLEQLTRLDRARRDELAGRLGGQTKTVIDAYLRTPLRARCPTREIKSAWAGHLGYRTDHIEQICELAAELQQIRADGATGPDQVGTAAASLGKLRELQAETGATAGADMAFMEARLAAWRGYFGKVEQADRAADPGRKLALLREAARISQQRLDAKDPGQAARLAAELEAKGEGTVDQPAPGQTVAKAEAPPPPPAPAPSPKTTEAPVVTPAEAPRDAAPTAQTVASLPPAATAPEAARSGLLVPTDSMRDLELQIASYLQAKGEWKVEVQAKANEPDDLYLSLLFASEGMPTLRITIDTFVSARDKASNAVAEQVVKIQAYAFDSKHRRVANRARFYDFANKWMAFLWIPQRMYLDAEGEFILEWNVNLIPGGGVHIDQIHDAIAKLSEVWRDMVPELRKASVIH